MTIEWTTLRAHMRARYSLEYDDAEGVRLTWNLDGVLQPQWFHPASGLGMQHVMVVCPIVGERELPPRDALRHNNNLAVGTIALARDGYVMRAVLPLDLLSFHAFDRMIEVIAHEAARIRTNIVRARGTIPPLVSVQSISEAEPAP